jgi:N-acetylmuramoyl-L-alanine amidase
MVIGWTNVTGIRHWSTPEETRIVLDLSHRISYRTFRLSVPPRVVLDLSNVTYKGPRTVEINDAIVKSVRIGTHDQNSLRFVVDLKGPFPYYVSLLKRFRSKPDRILIRVTSPELEGKESALRRSLSQVKVRNTRIVVIDPGHGGEDPGTVGRFGTKEKNVVFSISKRLQKMLNQKRGTRAYLTRKGDYFTELQKRMKIAREYGADIFISIHTDANFNRGIRGASVYCLSLKGATDEAARILAEEENASDLIGGVISKNGDSSLDSILLDLIQTKTLNYSLEYAGMVIRELSKITKIKFDMPRQAGFHVLKSPEFPSTLVEVAFLSNGRDERLMKSNYFKNQVAEALTSATMSFLNHLPSQKFVKR